MTTEAIKQKSFRDLLASGEMRKTNARLARLDAIHEEAGFNLRDPLTLDEDGRTLEESIEHLALLILEGMQLPPIEVRPRQDGGVWIVDGHRRTAAYRRAVELGAPLADEDGIVWIETRPFEGNDAERTLRVLTSAENRGLSPLEVARGYVRLERFGWTPERIGKQSGKTADRVRQLLKLGNANSDVQNMVRDGKVSAKLAVETLNKYGEKAGEILTGQFEQAAAQGKTKIKPADAKPKPLPRKIVDDLWQTSRKFREALPADAQRAVAQFEAGQITEGKVEIDVESLFHLVACLADADKTLAEKAAQEAAKVEKAKQQEAAV